MTAENAIELTRARSLLIILLATCEQTLLALDAAANVVDSGLRRDLHTMIERTRGEVVVFDKKLRELRAT